MKPVHKELLSSFGIFAVGFGFVFGFAIALFSAACFLASLAM